MRGTGNCVIVWLFVVTAVSAIAKVDPCDQKRPDRLHQILSSKSPSQLDAFTQLGNKHRLYCELCQQQLKFDLFPLHCYSTLGQDPNWAAPLQRRCRRWVIQQTAVRVLQSLLQEKTVSRACRKHISDRLRLLKYRGRGEMSSLSPNLAPILITQI